MLAKDNLSDGNLKIRPFEQADSESVQKICFDHFRSSCLAAIRYYIAAHFQDLAFLTFLGFCFLSIRKLLVIVLLFNLYLFLKSRYEMEQYIRRDCTDLRDVMNTYMNTNDKTCRFWVAEICEDASSGAANAATNAAGQTPKQKVWKLAGCVGLVPSRENHQIAKLVRLMVERRHRRMRIGSRLLLQLENYARENGYVSVRIYTNTLNPSHMKFVRQHGYTIVQTIRRGLMRGDLVTWHKALVKSGDHHPLLHQVVEGTAGLTADSEESGDDAHHQFTRTTAAANPPPTFGGPPPNETAGAMGSRREDSKDELFNLRIRSAAHYVMD